MIAVKRKLPEIQATKSTPNRVNLTDQVIRRSPTLNKPYRIWDAKCPGLYVRVQPSGARTFNVQWARNTSTAIGKFPHRTLEWARNRALKVIADAQDNGVPEAARGKARPDTFADFIANHYAPWVTTERKAGKATIANIKAQFGSLFNDKPLTEITAWHVEKFKAARLKGGTKPATVNRDLDRIRAALNKAVEWKLLTSNPVASVKRSRGADSTRVRFLDADEEKRLRVALADRDAERRQRRKSGNAWAEARRRDVRPEWSEREYTDHLAPLVLLALNTGLRRGELFGLTWDRVSLERKQLTVTAGTAKSGKVRHVPLNAEATDVVTRWKKQGAGAGLVFPGTDNARLTHINKSWASLMRAAGLADFHFHDCRHHFASALAMRGADLYTIKELLGHGDFAMTQRYAHLSQEHQAAAVALLGKRR